MARAAVASLVFSVLAAAQARAEVELPRHCPRATVLQRVGLTDVTVEYNSPAVRGRRIWGGLVALGQIWRGGDSPASRISFSRDVVFAGREVPAGRYALLLIPGRESWTLILNRNPNLLLTDGAYRPELDAARITVAPVAAPARERLAFLFADFDSDQARLDIEWAGLRVPVRIDVKTGEQMLVALAELDQTWRHYADAARYLLQVKHDRAAALAYIRKSLALQPNAESLAFEQSLLGPRERRTARREPPAQENATTTITLQEVEPSEPATPAPIRSADLAKVPPSPLVPAANVVKPAATPTAAAASAAAAQPPTDPPPLQPAVAPASSGSPALAERPVIARAPARPVPPPAAASAPPPSDVAPVIARGRADIQACYQRALRRDPTLTRGKLVLSMSIAPSGLVNKVTLDGPERLRALVEPCVREAVVHWSFPPSNVEYEAEVPVLVRGEE
jgi:hypothetical protein